MVNWKSKKAGDLLLLANGLAILILLNVLSSQFFFRADLTEEKRYSIKKETKHILENLDEEVYIEVYLEGELNASFRRFRNAIRETLEEFRIHSGNRVQYSFTDPAAAKGQKAQSEFMTELASKGIQPTRVVDKAEGQKIEKIIFPGAVISFGNAETGVQLLKGNKANTSEEEINQSIEGIEYELINSIYKLTNDAPKRIGVVTGHGEPDNEEAAAFTSALLDVYDASKVSLRSADLNAYDALVIAKPTTSFSEIEKYRLDQFIIKRGNVLFLLDKLEANMDSASLETYYAFPYNLNLDDQLFRYGVRINMDLVQDRLSAGYPVVTGETGGKPRIQLMEWPFFPLINRYADHPITLNLDRVVLRFASSIDTVKAPGIKKTPLLFTSQYSRTATAPVNVSITTLRKDVKVGDYTRAFIPVGYLLEGKFTSVFKNRFLPEGENPELFKEEGRSGKIIVVSDGDLARNVVNPRTREPQPLGYDPFTNYTFANKDLLMNMMAYLTDENGLIKARNKEIRIRPLDKEKIVSEKLKWQLINLGIPVIMILIYGIIRTMVRKKRYADF
jgi:gliding-associated putative ABC transporter substrate-binding component GldG